MGHFDIVTTTLENAGWYPFLSNMEDGYVIYHVGDDIPQEIVYADWDVIDGGEHIRLIDPRQQYDASELARCEITGNDDTVAEDIHNFLWNISDFLGN